MCDFKCWLKFENRPDVFNALSTKYKKAVIKILKARMTSAQRYELNL
jgi:hypothetical protein